MTTRNDSFEAFNEQIDCEYHFHSHHRPMLSSRSLQISLCAPSLPSRKHMKGKSFNEMENRNCQRAKNENSHLGEKSFARHLSFDFITGSNGDW